MQCADHITHYRLDGELYDYFAPLGGADTDAARRIQQAVGRALGPVPAGPILDAGSGNGWLAKERGSGSATVVACDISLRNLKRIAAEHPARLHAVAADAHRLPFRDQVFRSVVASEMLEHVNSPGAVLAEFRRASHPGATLVISTPYKEAIRTTLCIHCNKETPWNAHLHSFDEFSLGVLLGDAGWLRIRPAKIQNKAFITLRISSLLRFLPYLCWRLMDSLFMFIYPKANTIVLTARNSSESAKA